jgi:hypothetical protein
MGERRAEKFNELQNEHTGVLKVACKLMEEANQENWEKISQLSHLFSEEKPSASHMCARISLHTYDRRNE